MHRRNHGGGCCGITHYISFYDFSEEDAEKLDRDCRAHRRWGHLIEVTLIDEELVDGGPWGSDSGPRLVKCLKRNGFRSVSRFFNVNSGNYVTVFHMHRNPQASMRSIPGFGRWEP